MDLESNLAYSGFQKEIFHNDWKTAITILLNRTYEVKKLLESYNRYSAFLLLNPIKIESVEIDIES